MNLDEFKIEYPNLFAKLPEDFLGVREILVVEHNYSDVDSDEATDLEPEDYNYYAYITEDLQDAIGRELVPTLVEKLDAVDEFDDFYAPESDLYGVQTELDEEGIAKIIYAILEEMVS